MTTTISVLDPGLPGPLPVAGPAGLRVDGAAGLVFIGGQISAGPTGEAIAPDDIEQQLRNVFDNIRRVLRDAGAEWRDVVRLDVFYVPTTGERSFWSALNRVAAEYLPDPGPVWTAVQVTGFAYPGLLVEIDGIAVVGAS